jgi:beta-xylosidase
MRVRAALVQHPVQHCVERYGVPDVRAWNFEVWNEPNLPSFSRNGTQAQYFELYSDLALLWWTKPLLAEQHNRITAPGNSAVIRFADAFC